MTIYNGKKNFVVWTQRASNRYDFEDHNMVGCVGFVFGHTIYSIYMLESGNEEMCNLSDSNMGKQHFWMTSQYEWVA